MAWCYVNLVDMHVPRVGNFTDYKTWSQFLLFHCSTHLELLSSQIFESQYLVREFAEKHYEASGIGKEEAKELARSCVSQRDIQVY